MRGLFGACGLTVRAYSVGFDLIVQDPKAAGRFLLGARLVEPIVVEIRHSPAAHADEMVVPDEIGIEAIGLMQAIDLLQQTDFDEGVDVLVDGGLGNRRNFQANALVDLFRTRMVPAFYQRAVDGVALMRGGQASRGTAAAEIVEAGWGGVWEHKSA